MIEQTKMEFDNFQQMNIKNYFFSNNKQVFNNMLYLIVIIESKDFFLCWF